MVHQIVRLFTICRCVQMAFANSIKFCKNHPSADQLQVLLLVATLSGPSQQQDLQGFLALVSRLPSINKLRSLEAYTHQSQFLPIACQGACAICGGPGADSMYCLLFSVHQALALLIHAPS